MTETATEHDGGVTDSERSLAGYLLALSRPRFWLYLAGPALVGLAWGASSTEDLLALPAVALVAYFLLPANLFLYGVNDRFDAPIDADNPRKGESGPEVQYRDDRRVWAAVLASGALGLALLPFLDPGGAVALGLFLVLAVAYSAPPFRFKARPGLDSVSNGLYVLPGIAAYAVVAGPPPTLAVLAGWLWTMAMHTYSAIPDVEPDRNAGIRTTATVLGERGALAYCIVAWAAAAAVGAAHHPGFGALLAVYPIFGLAIGGSSVSVSRAYRWFPVVNAVVGIGLTLAGLWRVLPAP
ncbi:prenyltransferase [Halobacteriales archaeon Cl-PHB]